MNSRFLDPVGLLLAISGRLPPVPLAQIDCDELTAYILAFAFFLDMPAEVVTVATDPARPDQFTNRCESRGTVVFHQGGGVEVVSQRPLSPARGQCRNPAAST